MPRGVPILGYFVGQLGDGERINFSDTCKQSISDMGTRTKDGFIWSPTSSGRHGLTTHAVVSNTSNIKDRYDVIVIGAGFAGLTAARDLAARENLDVLLLEARDRIGGRTCTVKELGEEYEVGGQLVRW